MNCITSVSFFILVKGASTPFFRPKRGLRQACSLSLLLFLIVAEGLIRALKETLRVGIFKGIKVANSCSLSHLLIVDDITEFF